MSTPTVNLAALPLAERLRLVEQLWESILHEETHVPISSEERVEIERRLAHYDANPEAVIPWEDARTKLASPAESGED